MKIAVIGAGAIGNLVAGYLKRAEEDVLLIARPDLVGAIQASGLHLSGARGAFQVEVAISGHLDEAPDLAILAVKTQDIPEALDKSKELLKKSILVTTQNGIQADVIASRHHPRECIVPSIVMFGATCLEPGQVVHNFEGSWIIGRLFATDEEILQKVQFVLNKAFPTVISDNIKGMKYLKVFVNANNCIPAILGMSMQEAFSDVATSRICLAVWKEGLDIVTRSAIALASLPNFPVERLTRLTSMATDEAATIFSGMMINLSEEPLFGSILQSIRRGRPSEIDYINGEFVTLARDHNHAAPLNEMLVGLVHRVERTGRHLTRRELLSETAGLVQ